MLQQALHSLFTKNSKTTPQKRIRVGVGVVDLALSHDIDRGLWLVQNKIQISRPKLMQNFCSPPADVAPYIADSTGISYDVVTRLLAWSYRTRILKAVCSGKKPLPGRRAHILRPENM